MTERLVLLWDIDGTLLTTARAGIGAWEGALRDLHACEADLGSLPTAGLTDAAIAVLLLERHGLPADAVATGRLLRAYEDRLPAALHTREGMVLPGVVEILEDIGDEALSLLLTGNTAAGARAKLEHYGLKRFFVSGGAFCEGPGPREEIAERAVALAATLLGTAPGMSAIVIGDTPHDIRCGKAVGARTLAVATSVHTVEELEEHSPWAVVPVLPVPGDFRRLVGLPWGEVARLS